MKSNKPATDFKVQLLEKCLKLNKSGTIVYQLPLVEIMQSREQGIRKYRYGQSNWITNNEKVVIFSGPTGSGKSTLINSLINVILNVDRNDPYRFRLLNGDTESDPYELDIDVSSEERLQDQTCSQTKWVTAYSVCLPAHVLPFNVTIVDTPGFGDTDGIERDHAISEQIRCFLKARDGISHVNLIAFVVPSTCNRLGPAQKYHFDCALRLLGKDVTDNVLGLVTFSDAQNTQVNAVFEKAHIPNKRLIKVNNSPFVATAAPTNDPISEQFSALYWKLTFDSLRDFMQILQQSPPRLLDMTIEVIEERKHLETLLEGLEMQVKGALATADELRKDKAHLEANKNTNLKTVDFIVSKPKQVRVNLPEGSLALNCQNCKITCHASCRCFLTCKVMTGIIRRKCSVCLDGCKAKQHEKNNFVYRTQIVEEKHTESFLKNQYQRGANGQQKQVVDELLDKANKRIELLMERIQKSVRRLQEIALKPNPNSVPDYLRTLIENEKQSAEYGYQDRVKQLEAYYERALDRQNFLTEKFNTN